MQVKVSKISPQDESNWRRLYADYQFGYLPWDNDKVGILWSWLNNPKHPVQGFLAKLDSGEIIGFIHFQEMPHTSYACNRGYIDDIYVVPGYRSKGVARTLISAVVDVGRQRGWKTIRWIAMKANRQAQRLYDRIAKKTDRITYDLLVSEAFKE